MVLRKLYPCSHNRHQQWRPSPVEHQVHLLAQALAEVVQLLPLDPAIVVVTLAEPEVDLRRNSTPLSAFL